MLLILEVSIDFKALVFGRSSDRDLHALVTAWFRHLFKFIHSVQSRFVNSIDLTGNLLTSANSVDQAGCISLTNQEQWKSLAGNEGSRHTNAAVYVVVGKTLLQGPVNKYEKHF